MLDQWVNKSKSVVNYSNFVWQMVSSNESFDTFRSNADYRRILEHVSPEQGELYLRHVKHPAVINTLLQSSYADTIGQPHVVQVNDAKISPTTIRYAKVVEEILQYFPNLLEMEHIVEIGVGYGGQCRFLCEVIKAMKGRLKRYTLIDLPEVLMLSRRYLEHFHLAPEIDYRSKSSIRHLESDLLISNYAFSEFNKPLQQEYLEKLLLHTHSGYLTINSHILQHDNCYAQDELVSLLPNAICVVEEPLEITGGKNYILTFRQS